MARKNCKDGKQLKIKTLKNGLYFKLEKSDFKGLWQEFLKQVKRLPTWAYEPVELKNPDQCWFIGQDGTKKFYELKKEFIDDVIELERSFRELGFKPIPRRSNFRRR